jgi:hypothetical protein
MKPVKIEEVHVCWDGPYSWPSFEKESRLRGLPRVPGVYLQTFEYLDGFLVYAAGLTRRPVLARFKEHTRQYMNGEYNVLDIDAANQGVRKEIWHGWGYARDHREEFEQRKIEIQSAVRRQLSGFRVFVAQLDTEGRILERVEASIMNHLNKQPSPYCSIPDQGMMLAPRRKDENPLLMISRSVEKIHAMDQAIEI